MIISKAHRFVFAAIPKTGTHSVRQALRENMSDDDLEQVGLFVDKRLPFEELARIGHGHITLGQIRPYLGEDAFSGYFKFGFVRNPFDRFVSYCAFMTRKGGEFAKNPRGVMRHVLFNLRPEGHILFKPQHIFVSDADGKLLADYIGRVEDMQTGYDEICGRLGIPSRNLDRVNGSQRGPYQGYYDSQLIDGVSRYYKKDLELFGYSFD